MEYDIQPMVIIHYFYKNYIWYSTPWSFNMGPWPIPLN